MAIPTEEELEKFLAGQEPGTFGKKKRAPSTVQVNPQADQLAVEAATQLTPGANFGGAGTDATQRHLGSGTPGPGPRIANVGVRPATRLAVPETVSKIDVSASAPPAASGVPAVEDRFADSYEAAKTALNEFDARGTGNVLAGRGRERAARRRTSSDERRGLLREVEAQRGFVESGSFADKTNVKAEQRQQQAASATALLGENRRRDAESEFAIKSFSDPKRKKNNVDIMAELQRLFLAPQQ